MEVKEVGWKGMD